MDEFSFEKGIVWKIRIGQTRYANLIIFFSSAVVEFKSLHENVMISFMSSHRLF
jgi:hypothetical protein